ncbi:MULTISPECIES: hypothetical protein [Nocardiopsis]|uniref:Uncharacterized protein n=1 Tax=Nocardiopsis sinuspersici TaxID=501010 RepID=A0A1V3BW99_9ACTN|nr:MULTISPECIES: hypothetical protein [Nocardiopsis]OOC52456.1 hypothetical protein NOSIN_00235 [Nocardiopsis sinuspersici]
MQNHASGAGLESGLDEHVQRALERAHTDLPPEGVTVQASDEATMREELLAVLLDDAEHHRGHAA